MKQKKMIKLSFTIPKKSAVEISEFYTLLDLMRSIKIKELQLKKKIPDEHGE
jgi:hypothetical protein